MLRYHYLSGARQAELPIASFQLEIEDSEETLIGISDAALTHREVIAADQLFGLYDASYAGIVFYSGQVLFHGRSVPERTRCPIVRQHSVLTESAFHPVDAGGFPVHPVIAELERHIG